MLLLFYDVALLDYYICSAFVLRVYYMIITVLPLFRENSRKFEKVGEDRRRLEKIGEGWRRLDQVREGRRRLDEGRSTYVCKIRPMYVSQGFPGPQGPFEERSECHPCAQSAHFRRGDVVFSLNSLGIIPVLLFLVMT